MKFYTVEWIKEIFENYYESYNKKEEFYIEDKEIVFEPEQFLFALLHIYKKNFYLLCNFLDIASLEKVKENQKFDFMHLVDLLRKEFSYWFKENLIFGNFPEKSYFTLAYEFLILEEQLKKQIQIPLLDQLKKLVMDLEEIIEKKQSLEQFEEHKFLKLLRFFNIIEILEPSLSLKLINRAKETAKKVYKNDQFLKIVSEIEDPFKDMNTFKTELKEALNKELNKFEVI